MYLSVADIANPNLFACGSWTWISLDITRTPKEYTPLNYYGNSDQSSKIQRDVRKKLFRLRIWSPRQKYENKIKTENSKSNIPENVMVKTVNTTSVSDVTLGVMNVSSLGNKMDCVIDHITDNRLDIVGITETWLSNNDKNNMPVINICLDSGYTLHHRPRNTSRRGGGVGVLINNHIKHQSRILHDNHEITSF